MPTPTTPRTAALGFCALLWASACDAGRPLTVDDANVNDPGDAHVEMWMAREPGRVRTWTVAPAIGLVPGLELGAAVSRNNTEKIHVSSLQLKVRWTESQPEGCNLGTTFAYSHTNAGGGEVPQVTGLLTCNRGPFAFHGNLGALRLPHGGHTVPTWGFALEYDLGAATVHAETFGQRHFKPAFQIGARTDLLKNLQLDATLGRQDRTTLFSVGAKISF